MAQEASRESSKYVEGMHRLAEQWPYLRYLGMGAWWAWIWLCYSGTGLFALWPSGPWAPHVGTMYLYSTPAIACALIAAAFAWRQATGLLLRRAFVMGCSCLGVLGSALIAVAPLLGGSPCFVLGGLLTGLGASVLALATGMVFGTLGRREVLTAGSIALVFAAFLYFMGTGLPTPWQPAFNAAIPERFGVSSREAQIMLLIAQGHSANWIAEDLVISKNTVRSHIRSIYTKLDVHSRRELLDFLATAEM